MYLAKIVFDRLGHFVSNIRRRLLSYPELYVCDIFSHWFLPRSGHQFWVLEARRLSSLRWLHRTKVYPTLWNKPKNPRISPSGGCSELSRSQDPIRGEYVICAHRPGAGNGQHETNSGCSAKSAPSTHATATSDTYPGHAAAAALCVGGANTHRTFQSHVILCT